MSSFLGGGGGTGSASVSPLVVNTYTTSHTLSLADAGAIVEMSASTPNTLTVPFDSLVAFPVGTWMKIIQAGTGTTSISGAVMLLGGVFTVLGPGGYSRPPYAFGGVLVHVSVNHSGNIAAQWDEAFLYKRNTDEWVLTL